MSVLDVARVIIYRFHEKGLEIFPINNDMKEDEEVWNLPQGFAEKLKNSSCFKNVISLDEDNGGNNVNRIKTVAIEGDWHDIPSIRGMLKHDLKLVKHIVKEKLPGSEKGAFFAIKEAFKKVLPQEYDALKELKDILFDKNSVTNI